jgi:CRP-like cAMP-binding protein
MDAGDRGRNLARLALFADLRWPELEAIAHLFDEDVFATGQRVLRQGIEGNAFYIVVEGEAAVVVDGVERSRLGRGDFFGEITALTGGAPTADVRAETPLRCLVMPGEDLAGFLRDHPTVAVRMLEEEARRLREANRFQ